MRLLEDIMKKMADAGVYNTAESGKKAPENMRDTPKPLTVDSIH